MPVPVHVQRPRDAVPAGSTPRTRRTPPPSSRARRTGRTAGPSRRRSSPSARTAGAGPPLEPVVVAPVHLHHLPQARPPLPPAAVLLPAPPPRPQPRRPAASAAASRGSTVVPVPRQLLRRQRRPEVGVPLPVQPRAPPARVASSVLRFDALPRSPCTSPASPSRGTAAHPPRLPHAHPQQLRRLRQPSTRPHFTRAKTSSRRRSFRLTPVFPSGPSTGRPGMTLLFCYGSDISTLV